MAPNAGFEMCFAPSTDGCWWGVMEGITYADFVKEVEGTLTPFLGNLGIRAGDAACPTAFTLASYCTHKKREYTHARIYGTVGRLGE